MSRIGMRRVGRWQPIVAAFVLLLGLGAGCDSDDDADNGNGNGTQDVVGTQDTGGGGTQDTGGGVQDTGGAQPNQVDVSLIEFDIIMDEELPAGPTTFVVTNDGTMPHNFTIEGNGIFETFDQNLEPGETMEMTVDLVTGTYDVYCPIAGHRDLGMDVDLTVTGG